ncbi:mucin-associated surface protein (MASP), putative [Trypanosoma cruzi marinkellei]|uniref:Mucin-associated surface protein (MASP), putative n=1 Tax=Trypanosoma cruzi marinkellei TaxID=85056 RepID=K2P984_TRYCR|nr:mucin-associated surface protein (MASP), putative [Trypanosoma cruzi marinkellei]
MMMAGRVLLVCALCVLWCGAGGGYALDFGDDDPRNEYYYGAYGVYCSQSALNATFCADKIRAAKSKRHAFALQAGDSQISEVSELSSAGGSSGGVLDPSLRESGSSRPGGTGGTEELNQTGESEAPPPPPPPPQQQHQQQQPSLSPPLSPPRDLEEMPKPDEYAGSESSGTTKLQSAEDSQPQTRMPAGERPATVTISSGGAGGGEAERPEENGSGQSVGTAGQQELNQTGENETAPPTTARVTGAQTNATLPDNITEENDSDRPEGEDEGTEASQPPHGNETETPTTATVTADQTNATVQLGDSDGSTASFHTTSPFLLLFILVCAAAAAVVVAA